MASHPEPGIEAFAARLESHGLLCPVLPLDVRNREEVVQLLELLMIQLEAKSAMEAL
jgi:hypothetical protein